LIARHHAWRNLADRIASDGAQAGSFENDADQFEPRAGVGCGHL
jgi:hypothetical protein